MEAAILLQRSNRAWWGVWPTGEPDLLPKGPLPLSCPDLCYMGEQAHSC